MPERKMTRTEQILLVVVAVVVAGFFYLNQVHDPLVKRHKDAIERHNKVVAELNKLRSEPVNTRAIQRSIDKLKPVVQGLEWEYRETSAGLLATNENIEEAVMGVNALAGDNGLIVEELKPVAPESAGLFSGVEHERKLLGRTCYRMRVSGDFLDFFRFMNELTRLRPLANVTCLRIESKGEGGNVNVAVVVLI